MRRKLLLVGRPAVGKTTIRKIIFEGINPKELINNPLEPTRGVETKIYNWMDLELGLFDISGQELNMIFNEEEEKINSFINTDAFIYVLEYPKWKSNSKEYIDDINRLCDLIERNNLKSRVIILLHKIDLYQQDKEKINIQKISKKFISSTCFSITPEVYVTSIMVNYVLYLYKSFFDILVGFSDHTIGIKHIIDKILEKNSKILCIGINVSKSIVVQSITNDFTLDVIGDIYKRIVKETFSTAKKGSIALKIENIKDVGPIISKIYKDNIEISHPLIKNMVYVFEDLKEQQIRDLMIKIRKKLNKYYLEWADKNLFISSN